MTRAPAKRTTVSVASQDAVEVCAAGDAELGEYLVQVVFDGAGADEQPRADFGVGEPVACELRNLGLLGGELVAGFGCAFASCFAGS